MQTKEKNGIVLIRLFTGEDIYQSLKEACKKHKVETGVILAGLGQVKDFAVGYFKKKGDYMPFETDKTHELLSMNGIVSLDKNDYVLHIHVVLGNEEKKAFGGHLLRGVAQLTNEIALMKVPMTVKRIMDEETGLNMLYPEG